MSFGEAISEGSSIERLLLRLNGNSNDSSGNGNNGTDTQIAYSLANGRFNEGALFNRALSSRIVIGTSSTLQPATALTFSMWIKIRNMPAAYCAIGGNTLSGQARGYLWDLSPAGVVIYIGNGGWGAVNIGVPALNTWAYIVGTWDGATVRGYMNGKLMGTASRTSILYSSCGFSLGNYYNITTAANMFDGFMDEVRVRARALTHQEIQKEYTNGLGMF